MSEAFIAIGLGLLVVGVTFLIIWDTIRSNKDDDDDDPKPPTGGGGGYGGSTALATRTGFIGGGLGGV